MSIYFLSFCHSSWCIMTTPKQNSEHRQNIQLDNISNAQYYQTTCMIHPYHMSPFQSSQINVTQKLQNTNIYMRFWWEMLSIDNLEHFVFRRWNIMQRKTLANNLIFNKYSNTMYSQKVLWIFWLFVCPPGKLQCHLLIWKFRHHKDSNEIRNGSVSFRKERQM